DVSHLSLRSPLALRHRCVLLPGQDQRVSSTANHMPPRSAGHGLARCDDGPVSGQGGFEMMTFGRTCTAFFAMIAALLPAASLIADEPTLTDIAGCNQEAAQRTGASALPAPPGAPGKEIAKRPPDGSREPRELPAHGGVPVADAPDSRATRPGARAEGSAEKTDPSGTGITQSRA